MNINVKASVLTFVAFVALALSACSNDKAGVSIDPISSVELGKDSPISVGFEVPADVDDNTDALRTAITTEFNVVMGSNQIIKPVIKDKGNVESFESVIAVYNKTKQKTHVQKANWNKTTKSLGKYYYPQNMTLPAGFATDTDEVYMLSIAGAGDWDESTKRLNIQGETNLKPVVVGSTMNQQVPFVTSWRKITYKAGTKAGEGSFKLADTVNVMSFKPQGIMLVINVKNFMKLPARLKRTIRLESNAFASKGYYEFNREIGIINGESITEGVALKNERWVTTNDETQASKNNPQFRNGSYNHYITDFTLQPSSGEDATWINLNTGSSYSAGEYANEYVLWLQSIPGRTDGFKNVFFGEAEVNDASRTLFTNNDATYSQPQNYRQWKPYLGKRFILGSLPLGLARGVTHKVNLRIVRPMLPIEYVSVPKQSYSSNTSDTWANLIWGGQSMNSYNSTYWRAPKTEELAWFMRVMTYYLTDSRNPLSDGAQAADVGSQGWYFYSVQNQPQTTSIGGTSFPNLKHAFVRAKGNSEVIYGLLYNRLQGTNQTSNYCVAARIRLRWNHPNVMEIEHYYIGPGLDMMPQDQSNFVNYVFHPAFWDYCIDKDAVIKRSVSFENNNTNSNFRSSWNRYWTAEGNREVLNTGQLIDASGQAYHMPWLKDEYKAW